MSIKVDFCRTELIFLYTFDIFLSKLYFFDIYVIYFILIFSIPYFNGRLNQSISVLTKIVVIEYVTRTNKALVDIEIVCSFLLKCFSSYLYS